MSEPKEPQIMADAIPRPVFMGAGSMPEPPAERPSREFERLVNADLRDKFAAGDAYKVLSRKENLVRWLQVLTDIRQSIHLQNAHDNAALRAHPDRPDGGPTPDSFAAFRKEIDERKRSRERALRAVVERVGEVRRLIGTEPLSKQTLGNIAQYLVDVDLMLRDGEVGEARGKLAALLRILNSTEGNANA